MNAYLQLTSESAPMLLILKALIDSGSEQRVITARMVRGAAVPKIVQVFHESAGVTAIRSGLQEGEKVVASGLFLIDSEANIAGGAGPCMRAGPLMPRPCRHAH